LAELRIWEIILAFFALTFFLGTGPAYPENPPDVNKVMSFDNVEIVYSCQGKKDPALVFIHGGFADRSFWKSPMVYFNNRYQVVAVDLAGHGDSGDNRKKWGILSFAKDVYAVIKEEKIKKAVLIGNSLGAEVSLQIARLLPDRIKGIVAVDTLHLLNRQIPAALFRAQAEAFRKDFTSAMKQMVPSLFHPDTNPELLAYVEERMLDNSPEMAAALLESFVGLDLAGLVKGLDLPIRCINGDLYPTQIEKNRQTDAKPISPAL